MDGAWMWTDGRGRVFTCRSRSQAELLVERSLQVLGSRSRKPAVGRRGRWGLLSASAEVFLEDTKYFI